MSEKFTPGPWEILNEYTGSVGTQSPFKMTASVYGDHEDCEPDDRMIANARLIAAAPDLLASLRTAVTMLQATRLIIRDNEAHAMAKEAIKEARAAIAKATDA